MRPPAVVITGPGTNRDPDVALALELAGADPDIRLAGELAGVQLQFTKAVSHVHDNLVADVAGDITDIKFAVGADDFLKELLGIANLHHVSAVGAQVEHAVAFAFHGDRAARAPFQIGEFRGLHEIDLGLERALEAVFPAH